MRISVLQSHVLCAPGMLPLLLPAAVSPPAPATYTCLPAPMLSGVSRTPSAPPAWPGCTTKGATVVWWGERCGWDGASILWSGVYVMDSTSGAPLPNCVMLRPVQASLPADTAAWLGSGCGVAPAAAPDLPTRVCGDVFARTCPHAHTCMQRGARVICVLMLLFMPRAVRLFGSPRCTPYLATHLLLQLPSPKRSVLWQWHVKGVCRTQPRPPSCRLLRFRTHALPAAAAALST